MFHVIFFKDDTGIHKTISTTQYGFHRFPMISPKIHPETLLPMASRDTLPLSANVRRNEVAWHTLKPTSMPLKCLLDKSFASQAFSRVPGNS